MHERDRWHAREFGSDRGSRQQPVEDDHVGAPAVEHLDRIACAIGHRRDHAVAQPLPGAELRTSLPVAHGVCFRARDVEVGHRPPEFDEFGPGALYPLARGAVGEHPHLVTPVDQLPRERELRRGIAAERQESLEDSHILHLSMTKMKMSSAPRKERTYRMTARADAAAATGERLLAAAWKHFGSQPYEKVRLREIAAEALVTEQTLLARFHSKDELLTAAYSGGG